jgi:hypothetical protein
MISRRALLAAALAALPLAASAQDGWRTYRNSRFGTTIDYPAGFRPGNPPNNNDGLSFTAADGATLRVWGSLNIDEADLAALEAKMQGYAEQGDRITYRAAGRNWFVLSGTNGERIFYRCYLLSHRNEIINGFEIVYPQGRAAAYDPVVARLAKSFRAGRGYQIKGAP